MTKDIMAADFQDHLEYHGNTSVERIRKKSGIIIKRDWIIFNTIEEALTFFNENC